MNLNKLKKNSLKYKPPRNSDYDNNVTTNNESISITDRLILPVISKDYYHKIIQQNMYMKEENWALLLT